jgi:hypothetical protein
MKIFTNQNTSIRYAPSFETTDKVEIESSTEVQVNEIFLVIDFRMTDEGAKQALERIQSLVDALAGITNIREEVGNVPLVKYYRCSNCEQYIEPIRETPCNWWTIYGDCVSSPSLLQELAS